MSEGFPENGVQLLLKALPDFEKRQKLFMLWKEQWDLLSAAEIDASPSLNAVFGEEEEEEEENKKQKRVLDLSSSSAGLDSKRIVQQNTLTKKAKKDIELSAFRDEGKKCRSSKLQPSVRSTRINEWWMQVHENERAGHVGMIPMCFQSGKVALELSEREVQLLEHFEKYSRE